MVNTEDSLTEMWCCLSDNLIQKLTFHLHECLKLSIQSHVMEFYSCIFFLQQHEQMGDTSALDFKKGKICKGYPGKD